MRRRSLGGLEVTDLALGTMVFGEVGDRGTAPAEAEAMIRSYLDAGGNHIDTANVYAGGKSEEIVGRAMAGRRGDVVIATKVRYPTGDGPHDSGLSAAAIHKAVESSLRRLGVEHVDLLYMHAWDPNVPLDESLMALAELVDAGKVRFIGVSNFKAWQLMKAAAGGEGGAGGAPPVVAAQYQYSLVVRDIEWDIAEACRSEGIGIVPWGPLGGGFLTAKYEPGAKPEDASAGRLATQPEHDEEAWHRRATERNWAIASEVRRIAAAGGWTPAQVALAWVRDRPGVSSVIVGARTPEQLEENLGAASVHLDHEARVALDEVSRVTPPYPYRSLE